VVLLRTAAFVFARIGLMCVNAVQRPPGHQETASFLFADILQQLASDASKLPAGEVHLEALRDAVASLDRALRVV
jgi:hypothetical protein